MSGISKIAYGPIETFLSYTGSCVTGKIRTGAVNREGYNATSIPAKADSRGFCNLTIRTVEDFTQRWFTGPGAVGHKNMFANSYIGSAIITYPGGDPSTFQETIGNFKIKPTKMEVKLMNQAMVRCHARVYVVRSKRFNVDSNDPVEFAQDVWPHFQPFVTPTYAATDKVNPMNPIFPHTKFMRCPTWHRYFEVIDYTKTTMSHGESKSCYVHLPVCHVMPFEAYIDSTAVSGSSMIDDTTLTIVVEADFDPCNTATGTTGPTEADDALGILTVTYRWNESVYYSPAQKTWGTYYTAPADATAIQFGPSATTTVGEGFVMNEFGPAELQTSTTFRG